MIFYTRYPYCHAGGAKVLNTCAVLLKIILDAITLTICPLRLPQLSAGAFVQASALEAALAAVPIFPSLGPHPKDIMDSVLQLAFQHLILNSLITPRLISLKRASIRAAIVTAKIKLIGLISRHTDPIYSAAICVSAISMIRIVMMISNGNAMRCVMGGKNHGDKSTKKPKIFW